MTYTLTVNTRRIATFNTEHEAVAYGNTYHPFGYVVSERDEKKHWPNRRRVAMQINIINDVVMCLYDEHEDCVDKLKKVADKLESLLPTI